MDGAAVDNQGVAGHVATLVLSEEKRSRSNLLGTAKPTERDDGFEPLPRAVRSFFGRKLPVDDGRLDGSRADDVGRCSGMQGAL